MTTTIRERMQHDLKAAMAARDKGRVAVLRTTLAALANAEAVTDEGSAPARGLFANEVARAALDGEAVLRIVARERDELLGSADEYDRVGQRAEADELRARVAVLDDYLAAT